MTEPVPRHPAASASGALAGFGRLVASRRYVVLGFAAAFLAVGVVWGTGVFGQLSDGGFEDPASESSQAVVLADQQLGRTSADAVVLYSSEKATVDDPVFRSAVQETLGSLPPDAVAQATTYWSTGQAPAFVSKDRHSTFALVELAGATDAERGAAYEEIRDDLDAPGLRTLVGGPVAVFDDVGTQVGEDLARAELFTLPVVLILLVLVFGSLAAAALPLAVGGLAVLGAFTALRLITSVTDVSVFAINIVTFLGLGLAIDYALFIVSRFREEVAGTDGSRAAVSESVARTMATGGRTVAFSGVTVAASFLALLFFPQAFLRSMGYGGIAAVVVAMVGALTVLPALLAVLGTRVDALRVGRRRRTDAATGQGWGRIAHAVMARPVWVAAAVVAVLLVLGAPFLRVQWGGVDTRVLPEGTESRVVAETLEREFSGGGGETVDVVVSGASGPAVQSYAERLAELPGANGAEVVAADGDTAKLSVGYPGAALSETGRELVHAVRGVAAPAGAEVLVGGDAAELEDLLSSLGSRLPWAAGFVVIVMFVLLFLAFGSVVLPVKALALNVLSLTATFGVVVWGFQDGHLAGLLGFTETGTIEATQPVLMLAIAFGLSMGYEVFLLSRIREEWDRTHDNTVAVTAGLQRTGRIITSAALLLAVVIGAFASSGITFIAMIGVGMVVAILVDATIVRALLVPATMRLLGEANWWAPGPLQRFWQRYGIRESTEPADRGTVPAGQI